MASVLTESSNSPSITHLASCPSLNQPTISSDEPDGKESQDGVVRDDPPRTRHAGETIRQLAKKHNVHRRMVRQALDSAIPPRTPEREQPKLGPVKIRIF
jgi:hypothetical protein